MWKRCEIRLFFSILDSSNLAHKPSSRVKVGRKCQQNFFFVWAKRMERVDSGCGSIWKAEFCWRCNQICSSFVDASWHQFVFIVAQKHQNQLWRSSQIICKPTHYFSAFQEIDFRGRQEFKDYWKSLTEHKVFCSWFIVQKC